MAYLFGSYVFDGVKLTCEGEQVRLTKTERKILRELVERALSKPNDSVSKERLKKAVWSSQSTVEDHTVHEHVRNLRRKMGFRPDGEPYISRDEYRLDARVEVAEPETTAPGESTEQSGPRIISLKGADPDSSPYVGPRPFPEDRSDDFFGRVKEVEDLLQLLSDPHRRVTFLYSPSGAGKTSLVNTALRIALLNNGFKVLPVARVGVPANPREQSQNPYTLAAIASMEQEAGAGGYQQPITWNSYLSAKALPPRTVLVLDQLEEIVTVNLGPPRQKRAFFVEIQEALVNNPSLRLLLAFREEYLAEMQRLAGDLCDSWRLYPLTLLKREDCEMAIKGPTERRGVRFDPVVLSQLVGKLATVRYVDDWGTLCEDPGEFVDPLQLQLVCDTLWRSLNPHKRTILLEDLRQASRLESSESRVLQAEQTVSRFVESVLHNFCEQAVQSAADSTQAHNGNRFPPELINLGCLQFITERGTRTPIRQDKDWTGDLPNVIADKLAQYQFLRIEQRHGERWYELAHDTLIQPVRERASRLDDDALRALFSNVVRDIAASERALQGGLVETRIAQECCLVFVAEDGSRLQVSREALEAASTRLPLWVIEVLVERGILRRISYREQAGYELTNWRLAMAIHGERFTAMNRLYSARKLLATQVERCRAPGASSTVWYQNSDPILKDIEEVIGFANLSDMEAKLALCASLVSGYHLDNFTLQIGRSNPAVTARTLREATEVKTSKSVRLHAVKALELFPLDDRENILINLAQHDRDESVQRAAATALAHLSSSGAWAQLFSLLDDSKKRASVLKILALIHDAVPKAGIKQFEEQRRRLSWPIRVRLQAMLVKARWQNAKGGILLAGVVALLSTIVMTVPPRILLAILDLTTTQVSHGGIRAVLEGILNGILGVIPWAVFIGGSLLVWWHLTEGRHPWRGRFSSSVGAISGLVGGIVNSVEIVFAYGRDTLATMSWLPSNNSDIIDTVTGTGAALIMPVYGLFIGLGIGWVARRMLVWWERDVTEPKRVYRVPEIQRAIADISYRALLNSWMILLPMLAAAVIVRAILAQMPYQSVGFGKLLGESVSLSFGGLGLVIGLFLGRHINRKGLHIESHEG